MRRRDFIARTAAIALLAALSTTDAVSGERIWRMGVLTPVDDSLVRSVMLPHLATRGFVEGRNLAVDLRMGTAEQMPELAQMLVGNKPDVIIAVSDWALHPARFSDQHDPDRCRANGRRPGERGCCQELGASWW
jgi:putative tryptophan/tyrosine transport system substrate-binding protein